MEHIRRVVLSGLACVVIAARVGGCASSKGSTPEEKRAYTLRMRDDAVAELIRQRPEVKQRLDRAAGYGAFSNIGTNIIFVSTGGGFGVVTDKATGRDTFMRMGELGVGIGLGVKDFRAVFLFYDAESLRTFITSGWEFGAEADAAAKAGDQGGAAAAAGNTLKGVEIYQFTENGIALSATVSGTKYWKDSDLNP